MYYPIKFKPIYKEMIWGGDSLKKIFKRDLPSDKIGESWDISCREKEMGIIANGVSAGKTFKELIDDNREGILGTEACKIENFPLLVKLIDANDDLSIQVHPNDEYAKRVENMPYGKTEMWYILDAPQNASLIIGVKNDVTKENFERDLENGKVQDDLTYLPVKKGDVIVIPSGLVHAITKGIILAEIQQNSDITYRVYDYNRVGLDGKPRELHVQKALDTIDFENKLPKKTLEGIKIADKQSESTYYICNDYFIFLKLDVHGSYFEKPHKEKFLIYTCVAGEGTIKTDDVVTPITFGESVFIPAGLSNFEISGDLTILKSYPHLKGFDDFLAPIFSALGKTKLTCGEIRTKTFCTLNPEILIDRTNK